MYNNGDNAMNYKLPKDCTAREIGTRARSLVVYKLNAKHWEWHEQTGTDHGTDVVLDYVENDDFTGRKIIGQIKGSSKIKILKNQKISFDLDVKTVNYALAHSETFVLFLADVVNEEVYYLPIQEYFISNPHEFDRLEANKTTIALHLEQTDTLNKCEQRLCEMAHYTYVDGPRRDIRRV